MPLIIPYGNKETAEDYILLFPANTPDSQDAVALFWDRDVNVISCKMYDDSANSWTETAILSSMNEDRNLHNMDGSVRHSDGLILCCAHSSQDTAGDDLRAFTINPNSIASPTIDTTTANVFTDEAASSQCGMLINQQNDDVYICWLGGGTWEATVDVVYKKSTDDMASWGTEQAYSEASADDIRMCPAGRTVGNSGGRFQPVWFNDDNADLIVNEVNDVEIAATGGGGADLRIAAKTHFIAESGILIFGLGDVRGQF